MVLIVGVLLCALLSTACETSTAPSTVPLEHAQVIASEWSIANATLSSLDVDVRLVDTSMVTWVAYDGNIPHPEYSILNGLYDPTTRTISWNTQTPQVIRHEAGHALLHIAGHPCWRCVSINGSGDVGLLSTHPGCKDQWCIRWLGVSGD